MTTRERLMAAVPRFREIPDLATLKAQVAAIASDTGLRSTVIHEPDHLDPFGEWVTIGFSSGGNIQAAGVGASVVNDDPWRM